MATIKEQVLDWIEGLYTDVTLTEELKDEIYSEVDNIPEAPSESKVFSIFLDDNKGHIILNADTKEEALEYFQSNLELCNLDEDDLEGVQVDIYEEETLRTTHTKPFIISYVTNL